jgi:hypothetical protein
MKTQFVIPFILSLFLFTSCSVQEKSGTDQKATIVKKAADLDKHVGKLITIKGEVTNTKIPQILGVDVASDSPDLRGKMATATGVLEKTVVLEKDVDKYTANRGAGTFYRLKDPKTNYDAQVQEVK